MRATLRTLLVILLPVLFLSLFSLSIRAQGKQGITVTPSIVRLDLSIDAPEAEVFYKNSTNSQIELSFSAQDFSELEEGGRIKFMQEKDAKNYQYGLTSWISFEKQSMTLSPGEEAKIKVFIDSDKLSPGGHYASIMATIKQTVSSRGQVPVNAILSTLLFVRTSTGNEREEMVLPSIEPIRTLFNFPDTFLLRLQNKGNVELTPYGVIEIKDTFGNIVARGIINEGSLIVLPESVRRFDVPVTRQARIIAPGVYKAEVNVHFGDKNIQQTLSFISWGINPDLIGVNPLLPVLIFGAALLFFRKRKRIHDLAINFFKRGGVKPRD